MEQQSRPKWTEAQQKAISCRGGTVLVSAAAGSGKTAVLVQRVIDILTDRQTPVDAQPASWWSPSPTLPLRRCAGASKPGSTS